ncbi:MAG TPA: hypothetical protein VNR38_03365 [Ureibacillus sp.]|nr:hypothetical protein [Ureibacillus sp.]
MDFWIIIGVISVVGIVTDYLHKQSKLKVKAMKEEIELEKLKQENFIIETEKIRLELEQTRQKLSLDYSHDHSNGKQNK